MSLPRIYMSWGLVCQVKDVPETKTFSRKGWVAKQLTRRSFFWSANQIRARRKLVEKEQILCRYWLSLGPNGGTKAKARSSMNCQCAQILWYVIKAAVMPGIALSMKKVSLLSVSFPPGFSFPKPHA